MSNLQHRQKIIQDKRKTTPWRDFVMDICSRRSLTYYKNNEMVSRYPLSDRIKNIVNHKAFEKLDPALGDQTKDGIFEVVKSMIENNPLPPTIIFSGCENAEYSDQTLSSKNVYLSNVVVVECSDVLYSHAVRQQSTDIIESISVNSSSQIYHSRNIFNSSKVFYCSNLYECSSCRFSSNCTSCHECVCCDGLEHKSYCIDNEQLSQQNYNERKQVIFKNKELYQKMYDDVVDKSMAQINCDGSNGFGIMNCDNCDHILLSQNIQDGKNIVGSSFNDLSTNLYDACSVGPRPMHDCYGVMGASGSEQIYCSVNVPLCNNVYYSYFLESCSFCLGCVGLRNKSFCIYNKQYFKEERYAKVDEIFGKMETDGILGNFFPGSINPLYFNDTAACLLDPSFTKEEVTIAGYLWRDNAINVDIPQGVQVVRVSELSKYEGFGQNGTWQINDEILKKVILDEQGNAYRIIPMELEFLRKYELPLPRKHWLDRMKENFRIG